MTTRQLFTRFMLIVLCAVLLAACSEEAGTVRIVSGNMRFTPDQATLTAGQPVTLKLVNTDGYAHSFDIDALNIHVPLPANTTATITFTPEQAQQYAFYCGATGHQKAGMVGTLSVAGTAADTSGGVAQTSP